MTARNLVSVANSKYEGIEQLDAVHHTIAQQISHALGIEIDKDVVRRILAQHYRPDDAGYNGPSWLASMAQSKDSLWSVDLFPCESLLLHSYWVLVVMEIFTRRISVLVSSAITSTA